jgi:hypothetical protein
VIESAARHDDVQVGMKQQILPPGVQDGEEAELCAEMFGIGAKGEQGFRGGAEQNTVKNVLIVEGEFGDLFGQREDDVKVFDRQQFGLPAFKPLGARPTLALGAMAISAGVVGVTRVLTVVALFDVAAQGSRAAGLNGAHNTGLCQRQRMRRTVSFPVLSNNVGHFESGWWHRPLLLRLGRTALAGCFILLRRLYQRIKWAGCAGDGLR